MHKIHYITHHIYIMYVYIYTHNIYVTYINIKKTKERNRKSIVIVGSLTHLSWSLI